LVFPLFFLSGALFPLDNLPSGLSVLTAADPVTYGVNTLRHSMLGFGRDAMGCDAAIPVAYTASLLKGLRGCIACPVCSNIRLDTIPVNDYDKDTMHVRNKRVDLACEKDA
jgi:hypothetical protein